MNQKAQKKIDYYHQLLLLSDTASANETREKGTDVGLRFQLLMQFLNGIAAYLQDDL